MTVYATRITNGDRRAALARLLAFFRLPPAARRIAIKLNLCDYRQPETGAVSDPAVVAALLAVLRQRYPRAEILLCENDASDTLVQNLWGWLGLDRVATEFDARCVSLAEDDWVRVPIAGWRFPELEVPRLLRESDFVINHPKLKTHGKTKITCALKNLFGCYRAKDKRPLHRFLDEAIVDMNLALRPHLVIVDSDLCVEGNRGPTQGLPKRLGLFMGGEDPVAVDAFCARLMGFRPAGIGHIRRAARAGVGTMAYELEGDLEGEPLDGYRFQYSLGKFWLMQVARKVLSWSDAG